MKKYLLLFTALSCGVASEVQAEKMLLELEGARIPLLFDTAKGTIYAGDSCEPLLFVREMANKEKSASTKRTFKVDVAKVRAASKGAVAASRLPSTFELDGDDVQVITESLSGVSRAYGKVAPRGLLSTRMQSLCKD